MVFAAAPEAVRKTVGPVLDAVGRRTIWLDKPGAASRLPRSAPDRFAAAVDAGHGDEDIAVIRRVTG